MLYSRITQSRQCWISTTQLVILVCADNVGACRQLFHQTKEQYLAKIIKQSKSSACTYSVPIKKTMRPTPEQHTLWKGCRLKLKIPSLSPTDCRLSTSLCCCQTNDRWWQLLEIESWVYSRFKNVFNGLCFTIIYSL